MKLTVTDFSKRYRFPAASASKILRRGALADRLTFTEDSEFKRTYHGSFETFDALAREELARNAKLREARTRHLKKPKAPPKEKPEPASPSRFVGGINPWKGLGA